MNPGEKIEQKGFFEDKRQNILKWLGDDGISEFYQLIDIYSNSKQSTEKCWHFM